MKVQVVIAMMGGVPAYDPVVTASEEEAHKTVYGWCEKLGLDPNDVFWWEVELKGKAPTAS